MTAPLEPFRAEPPPMDDPTTTPALSAERIAQDDAEVFLIAGRPSDAAVIVRDPTTGLIATITEPTVDTKGTDRG